MKHIFSVQYLLRVVNIFEMIATKKMKTVNRQRGCVTICKISSRNRVIGDIHTASGGRYNIPRRRHHLRRRRRRDNRISSVKSLTTARRRVRLLLSSPPSS